MEPAPLALLIGSLALLLLCAIGGYEVWRGRVQAYDPVDDVFEVVDECGRSAYLHRDDLCPRMDDGSDWDDWDPDSIGAAELDMIQQQLEGGGTRPDALDARRGL